MTSEEKFLFDADRYLQDAMKHGERTAFEANLEANPSLSKRVEEFRKLNNALEKQFFKMRLIQVEMELEEEKFFEKEAAFQLHNSDTMDDAWPIKGKWAVSRLSTQRFVLAVAAAAALTFVIALFWLFNRHPQIQQLAMKEAREAYRSSEMPGIVRSSAIALDNLFLTGAYSEYLKAAHTILNDTLSSDKKAELITWSI